MTPLDIGIIAFVALLTAFCIYRLIKRGGKCDGNCGSCSKNCTEGKENNNDTV